MTTSSYFLAAAEFDRSVGQVPPLRINRLDRPAWRQTAQTDAAGAHDGSQRERPVRPHPTVILRSTAGVLDLTVHRTRDDPELRRGLRCGNVAIEHQTSGHRTARAGCEHDPLDVGGSH